MSIFGWAWLGFGLSMLLRFFILSWDSVIFGNGSTRLAMLPVETINKTLMLLFSFWMLFSATFQFVSRSEVLTPFKELGELSSTIVLRLAPFTVPVTMGCYYASIRLPLPASLVTPLALAGSMWVIPASIAWWNHFRAEGTGKRMGAAKRLTLLFLLAPGVLNLWLNPYREIVLTVLLVPFLAYLFSGRRPRMAVVVVSVLLLLVVTTFLVQSYRRMAWMGETTSDVLAQVEEWKSVPMLAPWVEPLRRFHALDSMLLTIDLVPSVYSYREENLLVASLFRGFVPRAVYSGKAADMRAVEFGRTIWSYDDEYVRSDAAISTSMPGDLFAEGGAVSVLVGAVIWGGLVGVLESWRRRMSPHFMPGMVALFGFLCAAAIERDYGHTISTALQILVVQTISLHVVSRCVSFSNVMCGAERVRGERA